MRFRARRASIPNVGIMPLATLGTESARRLIARPQENRAMPATPPDSAGPGRYFPTTQWSRILAPGGARDLEQLARAYWGPMRAWLATRMGSRHRGADADDLTQEAFAWMLQTRLLDRADPARGRFRAFLKTALANFAIEHARKNAAQKRGGDRAHAPLDAASATADPNAPTPDQQLDAQWRRELLERACAELQRELEAAGRGTHFALFRDYFLADDETLDHRTLAQRHGIGLHDVSNWLDHAKRRYRARLQALVRETVTDDDALQEELRWLFGGDAATGRRNA